MSPKKKTTRASSKRKATTAAPPVDIRPALRNFALREMKRDRDVEMSLSLRRLMHLAIFRALDARQNDLARVLEALRLATEAKDPAQWDLGWLANGKKHRTMRGHADAFIKAREEAHDAAADALANANATADRYVPVSEFVDGIRALPTKSMGYGRSKVEFLKELALQMTEEDPEPGGTPGFAESLNEHRFEFGVITLLSDGEMFFGPPDGDFEVVRARARRFYEKVRDTKARRDRTPARYVKALLQGYGLDEITARKACDVI